MLVKLNAYKPERIKIHINRSDTFDLDFTLAHIIYPALKILKESKHGAPNVAKEDVPPRLWPPKNFDPSLGDIDENWFARWDWVLDEMIWAFGQKAYADGGWDLVDESAPTQEKYLLQQAYEDRMQRAFDLFGRYYQCLWS